jgi:hypothetical protein
LIVRQISREPERLAGNMSLCRGIDRLRCPELAADSVAGYVRAAFVRVKVGESGLLPVIGGMIVISIVFQSMNGQFRTAANLVNLLMRAAVFSLLAVVGYRNVGVELLQQLDRPIDVFCAAVGTGYRHRGRGHRPQVPGRRPLCMG